MWTSFWMMIYNSQYFLTILKKTLLTKAFNNNDLSFLLYFDDFDKKKMHKHA